MTSTAFDERALWDAEDVTEPPKVRDMTVAHATVADVQQFARRYHYSGYAANQTWRYGLWHGATLWGVAGYNLPTRETCEVVFGPVHTDAVVHLSRLALSEHSPRNSESRLIAGSLHLLARERPQTWAVITYADMLQGHVGYVYQATNALYTGTSSTKPRYIDSDGTIHGTYSHGWVSKSEARSRGWTVIDGEGKHRYLYILGNKRERRERLALLKLPILPYPKAATA